MEEGWNDRGRDWSARGPMERAFYVGAFADCYILRQRASLFLCQSSRGIFLNGFNGRSVVFVGVCRRGRAREQTFQPFMQLACSKAVTEGTRTVRESNGRNAEPMVFLGEKEGEKNQSSVVGPLGVCVQSNRVAGGRTYRSTLHSESRSSCWR